MSTCNLTITRKKQFVASLASYIVEIDGAVCGKIKNGSSLFCALDEGIHEVSFRWLGKAYKAPEIYVPQGFKSLNIGLKFNIWTNKLDILLDKSDYEYMQQQKTIKENLNNTFSFINSENKTLENFDNFEGLEFENWCANLLRKNGFFNVEVTKASGDQGVDILAEKNEIKYAIQCKCYSSDLGNSPVQEVHAGKSMYNCHVGAVMTNRYFTSGAKELAKATGVLLWDRDKLLQMLANNEAHETYKAIDIEPELVEAIRLVMSVGQASTSILQRRLTIGYAKAANLVDRMEKLGIISEFNGAKPRKIIMSKEDITRLLDNIN